MKIRAVLVATSVLLPLLGVGNAQATQSVFSIEGRGKDDCRSGYVCLYQHYNFNGSSDAKILMVDEDITDLDKYDFLDRTSSYVVKAPGGATLFARTNYRGEDLVLKPGSSGDVPVGFNDKASSIRVNF